MRKFILKRLMISVFTIFVLITVTFILVRLMPGDPFSSDKMTPEIKVNIERYYGMDKPVIMQYFTYISNLLKGDLGYSMNYVNISVNSIIKSSFPYSANLGIRALIFGSILGLFLGIRAALSRGKFLDYFCIIFAIIGTSVPNFIIGSVLQYFFGIKWNMLPVAQWQGFSYTILPSIALGFYTLAYISRMMRASMLEVTQQDYIKTAKSKGISKFRITFKHQLRNAILPIVTVLGPLVTDALTGTFVIESIFAIPGMGKYYVSGVQTLDYSLVLGLTIFYGIFIIIANTIVDILYGIIDPRIRIIKD